MEERNIPKGKINIKIQCKKENDETRVKKNFMKIEISISFVELRLKPKFMRRIFQVPHYLNSEQFFSSADLKNSR